MGRKRLQLAGTGWTIQEWAGARWNRLEYVGIDWARLEWAGIGWNMLENTEIPLTSPGLGWIRLE